MPSSFSNRPGFYEGEEPTTNASKSDSKPPDTKKPGQNDDKKKATSNVGDGSKGLVLNYFYFFLQLDLDFLTDSVMIIFTRTAGLASAE